MRAHWKFFFKKLFYRENNTVEVLVMWWGERMGWKCSKSLLALTSEVRLRRKKKYFLCSSFISFFFYLFQHFLNITRLWVESNVYVQRMDAHGWNEMLWLPIHHTIVNYYKAFLWTKDNGLLNFSSNSLLSPASSQQNS